LKRKIIHLLGKEKRRTAMPRFYINFRNGNEISEDTEGIEVPNIDGAREAAIRSLRELAGESLKHNGGSIPDAVIVSDDNGKDLLIIPITEVLQRQLRG
jgi:hypothetical protein